MIGLPVGMGFQMGTEIIGLIPFSDDVRWNAGERLLSPSLSSIQNGGEGARRAGEEALVGEATV